MSEKNTVDEFVNLTPKQLEETSLFVKPDPSTKDEAKKAIPVVNDWERLVDAIYGNAKFF